MNYQTFEPSGDLAALIKCYWTLESEEEEPPEKQTIVPDGCMEIIFHYGDLYRQYPENGNSIIQPKCFVIERLTIFKFLRDKTNTDNSFIKILHNSMPKDFEALLSKAVSSN